MSETKQHPKNGCIASLAYVLAWQVGPHNTVGIRIESDAKWRSGQSIAPPPFLQILGVMNVKHMLTLHDHSPVGYSVNGYYFEPADSSATALAKMNGRSSARPKPDGISMNGWPARPGGDCQCAGTQRQECEDHRVCCGPAGLPGESELIMGGPTGVEVG